MSFHSALTLLMPALGVTSAIVYCFARGKGILVVSVLLVPAGVVAVLSTVNIGELGWAVLVVPWWPW
ncbi:MAG TPA: hypothetical protein VNB23_07555 [Ramlibacter sp.]|nr:hypothetical protein [Ramlibacter sp.]